MSSDPGSSAPRTILVVDDDPSMLMTAAANIELAGYRVLEAPGGEEALAMVETDPTIDLVLSDVRMPGLNGLELHRRIRLIRTDLPVIMMTAFAVEEMVSDALLEGVYTVVGKPFDVNALVTTIGRAVRRPAVLVVDDQTSERESIRELLASCGCRAVAVATAEEALTALQTDEVDVAIIDLVMPGADGVETLRVLQERDPTLGVVMMTGYSVPELVRRAAQLGSYACLRKPFDVLQIARTLGKLRGPL